jgi:ribosome biogenesis GTPase
VKPIRDGDERGCHSTTSRQLFCLPAGGILIDTPGMRELQLWDAAGAVRETFEEIEALAAGCHFTNCRHQDEPRCAVKAAVANGQVSAERLASYQKLQEELTGLAKQQDERAELDEKRRGKLRRR